MKAYLHNGSFEAFLNALEESIASFSQDNIICSASKWNGTLFAEEVIVSEDRDRARFFLRKIREEISHDVSNHIIYCCCAEDDELGAALSEYLHLAQIHGAAVDGFRTNQSVRKVLETSLRASRELHRFKGLLRFRKLRNGVLWAPFEPDNDIVMLLAKHFERRMHNESWIIHDQKRHKAVCWDRYRLELLHEKDMPELRESPVNPELSEEENYYQKLWQAFFEKIAIKERTNAKLQAQNMPRRYWKNLPEFKS